MKVVRHYDTDLTEKQWKVIIEIRVDVAVKTDNHRIAATNNHFK